ncbi:MAG: PaaI family thioesterase [Rhodococcus sp. (in: high G+C Gram-positive bacteria)]|uniref:PaaI family thioesterase n=1 Tax=Rhodococcus sp. TaxID=1831 RepID=UPI003BB038C2
MTDDVTASHDTVGAGVGDRLFSLEFGRTLCVGCRPAGRCRFGLSLRRDGDSGVVGTVEFSPEHEGSGGVTHGGSVMGAFDEACGAVPMSVDVLAVTARLEVDFLRPVPLERELQIRAWPQSRDERGHWIIRAEIALPGATGPLCRAEGRFVERDPETHYRRFHQWLDQQPGQD